MLDPRWRWMSHIEDCPKSASCAVRIIGTAVGQPVYENQPFALRMASHRADPRTKRIGINNTIDPINLATLQIEPADAIGRNDLGIRIPRIEISESSGRRQDLAMIQRMADRIESALSQAMGRGLNPLAHTRNNMAM